MEVFKAAAKCNKNGLIFTFIWAFDEQEDWDFVEEVERIITSYGGNIYMVELGADVNERLQRNKTSNRLEKKPSKRNIEASENELLATMKKHRLNSKNDEIARENYIKMNNTDLGSEDVARVINEKFLL